MGHIVEQPGGLLDNLPAVRPHEQRRAGLQCFWAFRVVAQHQHRLAQRRGFLLYPAGIRQDEVRMIECRDKVDIIERR
jgi:hypothetical protein